MPSSDGKFSDLVVFRSLLSPSLLDTGLFENTYRLKPVPTTQVPVEKVEERLNIQHTDKRPVGSTLKEQISSILAGSTALPEYDPTVLPERDRLCQSLTYFLSRFVMNSFPKKPDWTMESTGLDPLTAALFFLNDIARITGQSIAWMQEIHRPRDEWAPVIQEHPLNLRPDGPLAWEWRQLLGRVRGRLNVLLYPELREVSEYAAAARGNVQITRAVLRKELRMSYRRARHTVECLRMIFSERFLPEIRRLGLQYRYCFSPKQRYTLWSKGLIERMTVDGSDVSSVCVHLEPSGAEGPSETGLFQVVVDAEMVSFQLNRFQADTGWTVGKWPPSAKKQDPRDIPDWLIHESSVAPSSFQLKKDDPEVLAIMWAHRGSQHSRHRLLGLFSIKGEKRSSTIGRILNQGIASVMYHPTLDLSGLPEGVVLGIRDSSKRQVTRVKDWLLWALPYARVLTDVAGRNLVIYGRLPLYRSGIYAEMLDQTMKEEFDVDYRVGRLETSSTYFTTVLNRLYDYKAGSWLSPW